MTVTRTNPSHPAEPRVRRLGLRAAALAFALVATPLLVGCDNSPTEPIPSWEFKGLLRQEQRTNHFFSMPESDVVRITLADVRPVLIELPDGEEPAALVLGVALGRVTTDAESLGCSVTLPLPARIGGSILVSLEQQQYCIVVWDPSNLPPGGIVEYTVTVDPQN